MNLSVSSHAHPSAVPFSETRRGAALLLWLYWLPVVLACAWVLSFPVFPSQDGPLHLYYVNVLRHLLAHQPGPYTDTYVIKGYITPYSSYYYSLICLGKFVTLEMADKIIVCLYLILFATSTRALIRSVTKGCPWAPFCILPVLLNWPLLMGFVNYSLSTCLGCFALAAWCSGVERRALRYRVAFLLLITLMMVTHPIPWLLVLGFVFFELGVRLIRSRFMTETDGVVDTSPSLWLDLTTAAVACLPYFYIRQFKGMVQTVEPEVQTHTPLARFFSPHLLPFAQRAQSFLRTFGVDIYAGSESLPRLYRAGISFLVFALLVGAVAYLVRHRRSGAWPLAHTWLLFSLILLPLLLFLPDKLSDHFYFISRLGILFFVSCVAGGSIALRQMPRLGACLAALSYALSLLTLGLAVRHITPVANAIATLGQAPLILSDGRPGLAMQAVGSDRARGLDYLPFFWAGAHYFRQHDLVLFNTAWLGDPIILVGARSERLPALDASFYEGVPVLPSALFPTQAAAARVLGEVNFALIMREGTPASQSPLAARPGEVTPGWFAAGWRCTHGEPNEWSLCVPPGTDAVARGR